MVIGAGAAVSGVALSRRNQPPQTLAIPTPRAAAAAQPAAAAAGLPGGEFGGAVGITTIAGPVQKRINRLPAGPLYWQVETFPTLQAARAAEQEAAMSVEAQGRGWLFTLAPQGQRSSGATLMAEVGPIPAPVASEYMLQLSLQTRARGIVGTEHSHPGVESWYLVEGEQMIRLPTLGEERSVKAGEGLVGPPANVPLQIFNVGAGQRTAFNMFVLDSTKPLANEGADVATIDAAFKKSFQALDLDGTMALFAEETVMLSPFGVFPGKPAIRASVDTFIRANPGFRVTAEDSEIARNTAVHRVQVTSEPIRASGVPRFVLIHTLVVNRGKIVTLSQNLDLADVDTARYALGLAPEGR